MSITYEFGKIIVDKNNFNGPNISNILEDVFNSSEITRDNFFTPSEVIFHNCRFKDVYFTLYNTDIITLTEPSFLYAFNNAIEKFKGEYSLNLTIKFEFCDYYSCSWVIESIPRTIPIYDPDHRKICNLSIFIDSNKIIHNIPEDVEPTYPCNLTYGYKILCEKISSHIRKYYICKLKILPDSSNMFTIAGEIRTNKAIVNKIVELITVNSYGCGDDSIGTINLEDEVLRVEHERFSGPYNSTMLYEKGNYIISDGLEVRSFRSTGPGIYMFTNQMDAILYLYRILGKEQLVVNIENGRVCDLPGVIISVMSNEKVIF